MSEIVTPIIYQLSVGGVLGFFVGYALKKALKILALIMGLFAVCLLYLGHVGALNINYDRLFGVVNDLFQGWGEASQILVFLFISLPFSGSFLLGGALGFKKG